LEIVYYKSIDSTHQLLISEIKKGLISRPKCIVADMQTNGIGSRGNSWIGQYGNLFMSICVELKQLPNDLPLQSNSIYFASLFKDILSEEGSKTWVKWPNDFYVEDKKIGGIITTKVSIFIVCSIGLNIRQSPENFGILDVSICKEEIINKFIKKIKKFISWKKVFSKYKIEFQKSKNFNFHNQNKMISLRDAELDFDGSLIINNKKVYSLR